MSLQANGSGVVTGKFTVPSGVPVGAKLVQFEGRAGSRAAATFVGRGQITVRELRQVQTETTIVTTFLQRYDPLAETFTLDAAALISGVDVWVCAKGASGRTLVEIREVSNGVPTQVVVTSAVKQTTALLVGQYNRFSWAPLRLEAGREYAVVVACDDAVTAVGVAELGKFDAAQQRWVTRQPYQVGVLLSSSNASTWTPHQEKDLTFKLLATPLAATTATIALPSVNVTAADELIVLAAVERPTAATDCVFRITLPDSTEYTVAEGEVILLPAAVTGTIAWAAILSGEAMATPRLHKDVQLVAATRATAGTYVTRALPAGAGSKVSVYFEGLKPGTASWTIEVAPDGLGTGGWTAVPFVSGTAIGDGWIDYTYRLASYGGANAAVRVTLSGDARNRPEMRKFRVVVT